MRERKNLISGVREKKIPLQPATINHEFAWELGMHEFQVNTATLRVQFLWHKAAVGLSLICREAHNLSQKLSTSGEMTETERILNNQSYFFSTDIQEKKTLA